MTKSNIPQKYISCVSYVLNMVAITSMFIPFTANAVNLGDLNPVPYTTVDEFVKAIANEAARVAFPIAAIGIIYAGFLFVTAGGSEEKIRRAKKTLLWTVIGVIIVVAAYVLATAFQNFLAST